MYRRVLFILLVPLLGSACIKSGADSAKLFRIPWPNSNHEYLLQDIAVESFSEPEFLRGDLAEFFIQPELRFDLGRIAQPGTPSGRFVSTSSGSYLALDTASLQAVSIYAHLERLHNLDLKSGAALFLPVRQAVGINVGLTNSENRVVENNAQYNPSVDALLFVPYTDVDLPIVFNAGVIAHEHFHSIFQKIVLSEFQVSKTYLSAKLEEPNQLPPLVDSSPLVLPKAKPLISVAQYNRFVLRGINEGLADYWGWLYSGDESFVGRSLSSSLEARRMDRVNIQFYNLEFLKLVLSSDADDQIRLARAYALGSQYAVYFRNLSRSLFDNQISEATRAKLAHLLVLALPEFKNLLKVKLDTEYLAPEVFVKIFTKSIQDFSDAPKAKEFEFCKSFRSIAPLAQETCNEK